MFHFFVNLDKLLYSFKKKSLVSIFVGSKRTCSVETCFSPPHPSVCCEGWKGRETPPHSLRIYAGKAFWEKYGKCSAMSIPTWGGTSGRRRSRGTEPGGTGFPSGSDPRVGGRSCSCRFLDRGDTSTPGEKLRFSVRTVAWRYCTHILLHA